MANIKYKFDPKSATFKPAEKTWQRYALNIFVFFFSTIIFGLLFAYFIFPRLYNADTALEKELSDMEAEYQILNSRLEETEEVVADLHKRDRNIYRSFFDLPTQENKMPPIEEEGKYEGYRYGNLMAVTSSRLKRLSQEVVLQSKSLDELLEVIKQREKSFERIPAIQPIANKELQRLASGYGIRMHPILKIGKMHWGLDFKADTGTPVYATGKATVESAGVQGGYGNTVVLNHGYGYKTLYAHLSKITVEIDQEVKRGDIVGLVGNTGLSSGSHLHYEVHYKDKKLNPITFFSAEISPEQLKKFFESTEKVSFSFD